MDYFAIAFKTTAILHALAGYFIFGLAANEEIQESCVYQDRNPLAGDIVKYLIYLASWSLVVCGIFAFLIPKFAVGLAWISLAFYFLTAFVDPIVERRLPTLCKSCAAMFSIRAIAAAILTAFYLGMQA